MYTDDLAIEKMDEEKARKISELICQIVEHMGIECKVDIEDSLRGKLFNISSPDSNLLIGQRGANLVALQTLAHNVAFKKLGISQRFTIDVDDYRRKREWYLRETAKKAVERVKQTNRAVVLEPMPAYERRVIHAYLSEEQLVDTESIGAEPNRRIVIKPKAKGEI